MVQDDGKGLILIPPSKNSLPPIGARISVAGFTEPQGATMVKASNIEVLDKAAGKPEPKQMEIGDALAQKKLNGVYVEVPGMVVKVRTNAQDTVPFLRNRVTVTLRQDGAMMRAVAPVAYQALTTRLEMARIRARGQLVDVKNSPDSAPERFLWIPHWSEALVEQEGAPDPYAIPAYPIGQIVDKQPTQGDRPVRARGRIHERKGPNQVVVGFHPEQRRPPRYMARHESGLQLRAGDVVDLLGFPGEAGDGSLFEITDARHLGLPRGVTDADLQKNSLAEYLPVYLKRDGINSLTSEQVDNGWPVRLAGIVSYRDEAKGLFYL